MRNLLGKDDFVSILNRSIDENTNSYKGLVEMFGDDDLWISEWLYCKRAGNPLAFYEVDEKGIEELFVIDSAGELYDLLIKIMNEKELDIAIYRYAAEVGGE